MTRVIPIMSVFLGFLLTSMAVAHKPATENDGRNGCFVYSVDMQRAITTMHDGKRAMGALKKLYRRMQSRLDRKFKELEAMKKEAADSNDPDLEEKIAAERKALESELVRAQKDLSDSEENTVRLLTSRLEEIVKQAEKSLNDSVIVDSRKLGALYIPGECDLTDWLVQSADADEIGPVPTADACFFTAALEIDVKLVFEKSEAGKNALQQLMKEHGNLQAELDRRAREIEKLRQTGQAEKANNETLKLQSQYLQFEGDLKRSQLKAQEKLLVELRKRLAGAVSSFVPVLFSGGRSPDMEKPALPLLHCDVTDWAILLMNGKTDAAELGKLCPALQRGDKSKE